MPVILTELQNSSAEKVEPAGRMTISAALHRSDLYGREATWKPLGVRVHLEFAEKHLKDSKNMRKTILWFD